MDSGKKAFTLIEVLVVMAILGIMATILVGILNPTALTGRGYDARRKKDLGRIKVAFEEYFNDKECYPTEDILASLRLRSNCSTNVFSPWLSSWPCDSNDQPYYVFVESSNCPRWFKVITNLENRKDSDIPTGWYESENYFIGDGSLENEMVNYGISSTNVLWYDRVLSPFCRSGRGNGCYYRPEPISAPNRCDSAGGSCSGDNCFIFYLDNWGGSAGCNDACRVDCCNDGIDCS
jgi:prepilin-type N-terminal cleavage/methylation domain-containing protein